MAGQCPVGNGVGQHLRIADGLGHLDLCTRIILTDIFQQARQVLLEMPALGEKQGYQRDGIGTVRHHACHGFGECRLHEFQESKFDSESGPGLADTGDHAPKRRCPFRIPGAVGE